MGTIMTYNPRKSGATKGKKKVAKKKTVKKVVRKTRSALSSVSIAKALKGQPAIIAGMYGAKFGANKLSESGGDADEWDMKAYAGAALGAYLSGVLANAVKKGTGQQVTNAGIGYLFFKLIRNELLTRSEFAMNQLGGMDDLHPDYMGDGQGDLMLGEDGEAYVYDEQDGWRSTDESDRLMGDSEFPTVVPAGPRLGDTQFPTVVPAGPRLGGDSQAPYREAFFGQAEDNVYAKAFLQG